jgi:hypothetical protein
MLMRRGLVMLAVSIAVAGCGGSSGGTQAASSPPASPTATPSVAPADPAATAEITTNWEAFFKGSGGTPDSHIALLEDGPKFRAELTAAAKDPANAALTAHVTNVAVTGTTAAVTYDLLGKGGAVLLGGAMGEAVKVGTKWMVSKKTYCQLIMLQDPTVAHPGCG